MTLQQLAINRVRVGGLPRFPGATIPEQLASGRAQAEATLRKYVPGFKFNEEQARDVRSTVSVWVMRNEAKLQPAMASPDASLPKELKKIMGSSTLVQQWVIANFTLAARGMGPWQSGRVGAEVADPRSKISEAWATTDAQYRLDSFGMILKMDRDGDLEYIFKGPTTVAGFGAVSGVIVWAIAIALTAFAAIVVLYFYYSKKLELNNAIMRDMCEKAQAEGDRETIARCIEATIELQQEDPIRGFTEELGRVVLIIGGGYLFLQYVLPRILEPKSKPSKSSLA